MDFGGRGVWEEGGVGMGMDEDIIPVNVLIPRNWKGSRNGREGGRVIWGMVLDMTWERKE